MNNVHKTREVMKFHFTTNSQVKHSANISSIFAFASATAARPGRAASASHDIVSIFWPRNQPDCLELRNLADNKTGLSHNC